MKLAILTCALALTAAAAAAADEITFTHQGEGMGNINGVPFNFTIFTIHASGDTDNIVDVGFAQYIVHDSASIDILNVGVFDLVTPTLTFVNPGVEIVGVSREDSFLDIFNGPQNPAFSAWDMTTSIGPHSGGGSVMSWNTGDFITSGGVLNMLPGGAFAIFTAEAGGCAPDCNADGVLNILDFVCFQGLFATMAPEADCNDDGVYNILDFVCFQNAFQQGCD